MKEIYFTRYDDGLIRQIEIEKPEMEDRPGWAYVRKTNGFQWKFRGHRGWYLTQYKAVPHSAIITVEVNDEIKKDESTPIPISALSTYMNNQSTAIVAENERKSK